MKIAILTFGTRGDVQYNIPLAHALNKNGHFTTIISHKNFAQLVQSYNISFLSISVDSEFITKDKNGIKMIKSGKNIIKFYKIMSSIIKKYAFKLTQESYNQCKGYDIIIANQVALLTAHHVSESLNIPLIYVCSFPLGKTKDFASCMTPFQRVKIPFYNTITHLIEEYSLNWICRKKINQMRKTILNLPKMPWKFSYHWKNNKYIPTLLSISPQIFPNPKEWKKKIHYFGYWVPNKQSKSSVPIMIQKFIDKGSQPIYIGFGSMNYAIEKKNLEMFDKVLEKENERAIFFF